MSYKKGKHSRHIYDPTSYESYKLSRSKIWDFLDCPRCFYLEHRFGVARPQGFQTDLKATVDLLLKKEFNMQRTNNTENPLMESYGLLGLVPFDHAKLNGWQEDHREVEYYDHGTNLIITGVVDDLWSDQGGNVIVVDYKASSQEDSRNPDARWKNGYKKQMETYQWLLRNNGLQVSDTGYFVYCKGRQDAEAFDGKLEFDIKIVPYTGDASWVDQTLEDIKDCLDRNMSPSADPECDFCAYRKAAFDVLDVDEL